MKKVKITVQFKPDTGYTHVVIPFEYDEDKLSWSDPINYGYSKIAGFFEKGFVHDELKKDINFVNVYPINCVSRMTVSVEKENGKGE